MTDREKIINLAKMHGAEDTYYGPKGINGMQFYNLESLEAFYHAAQADAFEQAALVCETKGAIRYAGLTIGEQCAKTIRALKEKK